MRTWRARLRWSELVAGVSAAALVGFLFGSDWYGGDPPRRGWDAVPALRWLILVVAVIGLLLAITQATSRGPALPAALDVLGVVGGAVTAILVVVRLLTTGAPLRAGAFLGLAAVLGLTFGAFGSLRREQGWAPGPQAPVALVTLPSHRAAAGSPRDLE